VHQAIVVKSLLALERKGIFEEHALAELAKRLPSTHKVEFDGKAFSYDLFFNVVGASTWGDSDEATELLQLDYELDFFKPSWRVILGMLIFFSIRRFPSAQRAILLLVPSSIPLIKLQRRFDLVKSLISRAQESGMGLDDARTVVEAMVAINESSSAEARLSVSEIAANASGIAAGGNDSGASALMSTLYFLAKSPELQRRVRGQLMDGGNHSNGGIDANIVQNIIRESLRLHPPFPFTFERIATKNIPNTNGLNLRAGQKCEMDIRAAHTNVEDWGVDAAAFNPDREFKSDSFMPFGAGSRACPGQAFARLVVKAVVEFVAQSGEISLNDSTIKWFVEGRSGTLQPKSAMPLVLISGEAGFDVVAG